ncbi:MAG: aminotransferase class I/II-fold pyridoxal phosphate-dependent enzyme [Patescibacteria group bacterium]|nr:aminotransferase class I/II-fold pyridoxal phosphate-dependent enzyme [Patescibacteria group bacterium]
MMPLDRNESYWLLDDELVEAARACGAREFSTYPDYGELKSALAAYAGVGKDQVLVAPGSDAAIEHIARAYAGGGGEALLPVPTFYGYESILDRVGAKTIAIPYEERDGRFAFPLAKTVKALESGSAKVLFLCHPNNPLGCPLSAQDISELAAAARGSKTLVVSDEAYFEFSSGATFLPRLAELPNLIITRTLSKAFGLSGARVGYAIAAPDIIKKVEKLMLPWPVAHASVLSALALLARTDKVKARREIVIKERGNFIKKLQSLPGVAAYPSETNFVLMRASGAERVRDALLTQGIRVALGEPMSRFPEAKTLLKDTLRIAVPSPADSVAVLDILRRLFTK